MIVSIASDHAGFQLKKIIISHLKALKIDPSSYQVLNNIAGFYREEGNYKKSIDLYLRALELNPNNSYILNNLAKSYFDIDDFEKSEAYALRAHDLNKFDGNIKKILSFIYLRKQEYKKGWLYFDGRLSNSDFIEKNISYPELQIKILKSKKINNNSRLLVLREQGVGDEILYGTMYRDALDNLTNIDLFILASHDTELISKICNRVISLENGKIINDQIT